MAVAGGAVHPRGMFPSMPLWFARILMVALYAATMLALHAALKAGIPPASRWLDATLGVWLGTVALFSPLLALWAWAGWSRLRSLGER